MRKTTADYLDFDSTLNKALKILKIEKDYKIAFLVILGINVGLRISDILNLTFDDLKNDDLVVIEKKTKKHRTIKLNENVKAGFEIFKTRNIKNEGYIFLSNQCTVLSTQYVNRKLKELFGKKGLNISSHTLRKTFGRRVWENNHQSEKALLYLSELFNHSDSKITRRYLGIRQQELDDIYLNL